MSRFARFQTVSDLQAVAAASPPDIFAAMLRRLPGLPSEEPLLRAAESGAVLDTAAEPFLPVLGLAATLPDDDLDGFVIATVLLIADRLQDGMGQDDLYWHYDAHRETYLSLPADLRACILMGYSTLHALGRVTLDRPPEPSELEARPGGLVRAALTAAPEAEARILRQALDGAPFEESEALWRGTPTRLTVSPVLSGAVRHLFQTRPGWDPYRAWTDRQIAEEGVALPFPSALPLPHGTS
ncbi:MAG: hypothetical protein AAGB05_07580 [Pseudomonadota bacterium]